MLPPRTCRRPSRRASANCRNMPPPPTLSKVNPADYGIIYIALTANNIPLTQLDEYAETRVARASPDPGVAQVKVFGSYKYAARIYMNPYALAARGLTLDMFTAPSRATTPTCPPGLSTAEPPPTQCRATASSRMPRPTTRWWWPTRTARRCISAMWAKPSTASSRTGSSPPLPTSQAATANAARRHALGQAPARRQYSGGLPGGPCTDAGAHARGSRRCRRSSLLQPSRLRQGSISDVRTTLLLAIVLVVGVIFVFLRNLRATLISAWRCPPR